MKNELFYSDKYMSKYTPPHLRNSEQNSEQNSIKSVHFQEDQVIQSRKKSHKEHLTLIPFKRQSTKEEILESENVELRKKVEELNKRVSKLSEDVALYRGNREECIPKSLFDELKCKFKETMREKQEYSRKLKEIDDVHRSDTDSLRTEINILREELKNSEKRITYLSSNVTNLSQTNEQLKQIIESFNSSQNLMEEPKKEENSELIPDDWHNIKTSLRYLLNDQKIRKQFIRETGINLAGMKLTMEIIEKLGYE